MNLTVFPASARMEGSGGSAPLAAIVVADGTRAVVILRGEADLSTRPILADVLARVIAHYAGPVVIDLAELEFIDTATVRTLAGAQQLLECRGRKLTLRSPSTLAARVLHLFGLAGLIEAPERAWA